MKTVAIKVHNLKQGKVELYEDDGSETWDEKPVVYSSMPQDLSLESAVLDAFNKPISEASAKNDFKQGNTRNFKHIGKYLYRLLFQGDVKKAWEELRRRHPGKPEGTEGLRTILDIQPLSLRALPWELICENDYLFLDAANPFSRGNIPFKKNVTAHAWPLRALIIVGSEQKDRTIDAELEVESIVGPLREVSRTIEVDIMRRPTICDLVKQYDTFQPHIVHFIGHGGINGGKPLLRINDEENWTVDDIVNLKHATWTASFAFVNACRSGDPIGVEESQAVAEAFVTAGVPTVLSMLGDIKEQAAQTLAASVYEALARGIPLDQAVARGRFEVSTKKNKSIGLNTNQWALPSLLLLVPPDKVLAIEYDIEEEIRNRIKDDTQFGKLQAFVDRLGQRLHISTIVDPRGQNRANRSLLIVKGGGKVGKTWMVKLCLECCAMRGRRSTWVNAEKVTEKEGERSKTFLEVLRLIRDGNPSLNSLISPSLDDEGAFSQFNWTLTQLLKPQKIAHGTSVAPPNYKETASTLKIWKWKRNLDSVAHLFSSFRHALQKTAGNIPLVIVLDNMEIVPHDFNNLLIPHLILPIKKGDVPNVKLILVLSQKNETDYKEGLQELGPYEPIEVSSFKKDEFVPLTLEFLRYNRKVIKVSRSKMKKLVEDLHEAMDDDSWPPEYLHRILEVLPGTTSLRVRG